MLLNGKQLWFGIEPPNRPGPKPYCIPPGTYEVLLSQSQHFNMVVPCVQNVEGFTGIEIHPGNFPSDTHGCLCIGDSRGENFVGLSRKAFDELMSFLRANPTGITITYVGGV